MAKQRRVASPRTVRKKATARKGASPRSTRTTAKTTRRSVAKTASRAAKKPAKPVARAAEKPQPVPAPAPPAPPAPRKPGFYEAVAIYERAVQALQRHEYGAAAEHFRAVISRYPEERELQERAVLYLRVCERETARQAAPQNSGELVYAATVALNSGDHAGALGHLQRALTADANNDAAHYIMATALSMRGRREEAIEHLQRSIALNPQNRSQARQDPDFENIRSLEGFRAMIDGPQTSPPKASRRR